jgi:hypothetical protein
MEPSKPNPTEQGPARKVKDILIPLFWHAQCFLSVNPY